MASSFAVRGCVALLFALALLAPDLATARRRRPRHKPAAAAPGQKESEQAFAKGRQLFKARDFVGALEAFEEAYRLSPHFLMQCNIARCLERLTDMVRAAKHFKQCLQEGGSRGKQAAKIQASLAQVESRITWVTVNSSGKGGAIYVDGKQVGRAPLRIALNPGSRLIEVRRRGASPASMTVSTHGGETRTLDLAPKELALPPSTLATHPEQPDGGQTPEPPKRRKGVHQAWFWTVVGITAGCVVAAAVTGSQALKMRDDYEASPTREGYNNAKDRRLLANIFWGMTAAAAVSGTVLVFFTDFRGDRRRDASTAFGVGITGTF
jgi:hypothetical protein